MTTLQVVSRSRPAKRPPVAKPKETKQQREQRLKKVRAKKQELRKRLSQDPDSVLSFVEWCSLNGFSVRVGRYIIKNGNGPVVTQLSERRIGISRRAHREWLEKRSR